MSVDGNVCVQLMLFTQNDLMVSNLMESFVIVFRFIIVVILKFDATYNRNEIKALLLRRFKWIANEIVRILPFAFILR